MDPSGWSFTWDEPEPRLVWPDAARFTADECARLLAFRRRVARGLVREDTPEVVRLIFYRWAVRERGLFSG